MSHNLAGWRLFADSISMTSPLPARSRIYEDAHTCKLQIVFETTERDLGTPYELTMEHAIVDGSWERRHEIALQLVQGFYLHEIHERLLFNGVRRFDPHQEATT